MAKIHFFPKILTSRWKWGLPILQNETLKIANYRTKSDYSLLKIFPSSHPLQ